MVVVGGGGLHSCEWRGIRSTRDKRNTDPFKPRAGGGGGAVFIRDCHTGRGEKAL